VPSNRGVAVGGCLEVVLGVCGESVGHLSDPSCNTDRRVEQRRKLMFAVAPGAEGQVAGESRRQVNRPSRKMDAQAQV